MPKFSFRLQPVLDQRAREEKDQMRAVAELDAQRMRIEEHIRACQLRIQQGRRDVSDALSGGRVDLGSAKLQSAATLRHDQEARSGVLDMAAVLQQLGHARAKLVQASAKRRAIELLRDRELERFRDAENRRESAAMDDLMVMRRNKSA